MNSSEHASPKTKEEERSAQLAASLIELAKVAAALSEHPKPAAPVVSLNISAEEIVDTLLDRILRPMPKGGNTKKGILGEVCPITGLKRNALYELMDLRDEAGRPVIEVISRREPGEAHGTRLYSPGSVLRHLRQKPNQQAEELRNKKQK